jgi:hypothetical protein
MAKRTTAARKPPATETLGNIISAFAQELARASVAADVVRLQMKNAYEGNSLLSQYEPSRIRLITAKVTLPVAFSGHASRDLIDPGLSKSQIAAMVSREVPAPLRNRIADAVISALGNQNRFANTKLYDVIRRLGSRVKMDGFDPQKHFDANKIKAFKNEWASTRANEQEARFVYRAEDLEKLRPDNIAKFDITLDIS